jgi:hypothetical protein
MVFTRRNCILKLDQLQLRGPNVARDAFHFAAAAFLFSALSVPPALAAGAPAGIVMDVSGATDPPLTAMTEIPADATVKLTGDAKLTFLDYARCKLVTVSGGTVTLSESDYRVDGHVESERDGPCPQTYTPNGGNSRQTTGGLIMRSGLGPPRWPVNARFLLTGRFAGDVAAAAIYAEDSPDAATATLDVTAGRLAEPAGTLLPPAYARYILRLTTSGARKLSDITFIGMTPANPPPFIILRLE